MESGFRIGSRQVFPLDGRIAGPDGDLRVEPKAMAVLVALARHAPAVCPREELVRSVWPRGFVSDDVLTRCIGQLRRALGDDAKSPAYLETLPKRGYRLLAPVVPLGTSAPPLATPASRVESLLVLPFQSLSAAGNDFVADGLTELLILRLATLRDMRVISRTTAMQFRASPAGIPEVAARTGADWIVEGSVLQSGDRLQVVVQLIDARTDAHIWAADYVRELSELLPLQNEIARRIAAAIRLQLGEAPEPVTAAVALAPPVLRSYLRGRHLLSQRTVAALREAREEFRGVSEQAPDHAPGWASLAECELLLAHYGAPDVERLLAECGGHLDRALTLDPDLGIAYSTRGVMRFFFRRDLRGAADDFQRALALLPSYSLAMVGLANICAVRGDFTEANGWLDQALLVDPLDVGVNMNIGDHRILQRRYPEAVQALEAALALSPGHRPSQLRLSWALALAGDAPAARKLLSEIGPTAEADAPWHEYAAIVEGAAGDPRAAALHYEALVAMSGTARVPAWGLARAAAAAGLVDAALGHLEDAARDRSSSLPFLAVTPAFAGLRGEFGRLSVAVLPGAGGIS